jgi:hypothetical protein
VTMTRLTPLSSGSAARRAAWFFVSRSLHASEIMKSKYHLFFVACLALVASPAQATDHLLTDEQVREDATTLITKELEGLYELTSVEVEPRTNGLYGDQTVYVKFRSIKNAKSLESIHALAKDKDWCKNVAYFYLLCRPKGHEFAGRLSLSYYYTSKGMAYRIPLQLKGYPLVQFMVIKESERAGYVLPVQ